MNQGYRWEEVVPADARGSMLLEHLLRRPYRGGGRGGDAGSWQGRLSRGEVTLSGQVANGEERLAGGEPLVWRRPPWEEPPAPLAFAVLHRDRHLLGVAKPAGLPTMPSGGRYLEHTLLHQVQRRFPEATPLHRLDRGTSGVVLFARSELARRECSLAWQRGEVRRRYLALVEGLPRADDFVIDAPIGELPHPRIGRVFAAAAAGRPASTRVRVLERHEGVGEGQGVDVALVELEIGSGRPHQIRIHLAHAGHGLVGEPFYGAGGLPRPGSDALPGDVGYLLHAERVALRHPSTGFPLEVWCAAPSKLVTPGRPDWPRTPS